MGLTKTEVQKFKKKLEEMKGKISQAVSHCEAEVKKPDEATGYSQHQADQGTDDFDRRISLEVTSQEYRVLRQIERALEKIVEGTYGICDISGEEIPPKRLEAMPYANTTVKAQEKLRAGAPLVGRPISSLAFFTGLFLVTADFLSKAWIQTTFFAMPERFPIPLLHLFGITWQLTYTVNLGAAWGLFAEFPALLVLFRVVLICGLLIYLVRYNDRMSWQIPLTCILSGAIGNVIDYFHYGYVIDMVQVILWGYHYPVFNLADSAICIGSLWILFLAFREKQHVKNE